jgi:hypothetical protein
MSCAFGLVVIGLMLLLAGRASARDLEAEIAAAHSRAASAAGEVEALKTSVAPVRSELKSAQHHAAPVRGRARKAAAQVGAAEQQAKDQRLRAAGAVKRIEGERKDAIAAHHHRVSFDVGLAFAALIAGLIALGWSWFRASDVVAATTRVPLGKTVAVIVGSGILALIVGGVMKEAGGFVAVLGGLIFGLGLALPVAFLLARHSAQVQRGRARTWLQRERLSSRVTRSIAGTLGALFFIALVVAATDTTAPSGTVTTTLRDRAEPAALVTPKLKVDEQRAKQFRDALRPFERAVAKKRAAFDAAQKELHQAKARLADATGDERNWSHQLKAELAREQRKAEREERRAQRLQEREEREEERTAEREEREYEKALAIEEHEHQEAEETEGCDPNYEGACLHDGIGDYDCAGGSGNGPNYVEGPIYVVGADPFGLDSDGDDIACEDG